MYDLYILLTMFFSGVNGKNMYVPKVSKLIFYH